MNRWQVFLDSLTTAGGRLLILLVMIVWLVSMLALLHVLGKDPKAQGILLLSNAFTSLFTALLSHLNGQGPQNKGNGNV